MYQTRLPHKPRLALEQSGWLRIVFAGLMLSFVFVPAAYAAWPMHVIDNSLAGADGVKLGDVNKDGVPDIVTGWEEGGRTRIYLNPGAAKVNKRWPTVDVGRTISAEDAVFVDLDHDGWLDVVSSCEGREKKMFVHWNPGPEKLTDGKAWRQETLPASAGRMQWMFAMPLNHGGADVALIAAGKNDNASIGLFTAAEASRDVAKLLWQPLSPAGWIMSIAPVDMDGDGDIDILYSDRRGDRRGCRWLENRGAAQQWRSHLIGGADHEIMFLTLADMDADGDKEVLAAAKPNLVLIFRRTPGANSWEESSIVFPEKTGTAKAVVVGDVDGDNSPDLVVSCEHADAPKSGVFALSFNKAKMNSRQMIDISGPSGIKFDRMELLDMDGDGDADVLTCEERQDGKGLGVIWYENPLR